MPKRKKSELNQTEQTPEERSFEIAVTDEKMSVRFSQFSTNKDSIESDREETEKLVFELSRYHAQSVQIETEIDAEYRMFRAQRTNDILKVEPKLAEWKLKARIESSPEFAAFKEGVAIVKRNIDFTDLLLDLAYHKLGVIENRSKDL